MFFLKSKRENKSKCLLDFYSKKFISKNDYLQYYPQDNEIFIILFFLINKIWYTK